MKKIILAVLMLGSPQVWAESIELSSGEVLDGNLLGFPKEIEVELSDGTKKKLPYSEISSIYKNTPPQSFTPFTTSPAKENKDKDIGKSGKGKGSLDRPTKDDFAELDMTKGAYSSPSHTFETWKRAAINDDIDGMANCYAESRKSDIKKELKKIPKKNREDMKMAMSQTIFTPSDPYYQGEFAIMEVTWAKGLASQTQTLKFMFENNKEWKIVE
jgi:hypothetical protein